MSFRFGGVSEYFVSTWMPWVASSLNGEKPRHPLLCGTSELCRYRGGVRIL